MTLPVLRCDRRECPQGEAPCDVCGSYGATEHVDERGIYYVTPGGQRYHYVWCHDCGGEGCDYCEGIGQIRLDEPTSDADRTRE